MPHFLTLQHQKFTYKQISSGEYLTQKLDDYSLATLNFCADWLQGKASFTIHTSGSTGQPKPIELTRTQMQVSAQMTGQALGLRSDDSAFICLNTSYIAGVMMLVRGFELGLQMTIVAPSSHPLQHWSIAPIFDFTALVPLQIQTILQEKNGKNWLNAAKAVIVGGAPVSYALEQQLKKLTAPTYATYGMTETVTHIALRRISGQQSNDYYETLPQVTIQQDVRHCLQIKSPTTLNQWITTNDLVELMAPNQFKWLGRIDRVMNSGGVKVQAEKVEKVLAQALHQQQISCRFFVAGMPHDRLGEQVVAILEVSVLEETTRTQLLLMLKENLSLYEVPKAIYNIPRFAETPTAKIDRLQTLQQIATK
ncbi:MAG TPA: acyl-CoA synthetase [Microscillaceae bacterium]|nr:acyl-CoA synthetase [Microscillaceae bacterium]